MTVKVRNTFIKGQGAARTQVVKLQTALTGVNSAIAMMSGSPNMGCGSLALYHGDDSELTTPSAFNPFKTASQEQWEAMSEDQRKEYRITKGSSTPIYWGVVSGLGSLVIFKGIDKYFGAIDPYHQEQPIPTAVAPILGSGVAVLSAYKYPPESESSGGLKGSPETMPQYRLRA